MKRERIKAISLDWEGCASEPGGGMVPWPLQKLVKLSQVLLKLYQETDIWFVINSGRQAPYIEAALQALAVVTDSPSICENGSLLFYPLSRKFKINPAITLDKSREFLEVRKRLVRFVDKTGATRELGKEFSLSINPPKGTGIEKYYYQITEEIKDFIENKVVEVTHSQSAVDITIAGVNKDSGLQFFLKETGISLEEMAGIGDSRGDWPVLNKVALPLSPVNATLETQNLVNKRGGYVSPYPTTQGVIDCIGQITENSRVKSLVRDLLKKSVSVSQ